MRNATGGGLASTHSEITLVADEHDSHVGVGMLPGILQPAGQVVKGFPPAGHPHSLEKDGVSGCSTDAEGRSVHKV